MLCKTIDLSKGGALLKLTDKSNIDKIEKLEFRIPDLAERVSTRADIRWSSEEEDGHLIGVKFTSLGENESEALKEFLLRNKSQDITQKASPVRFQELIEHLQEHLDLTLDQRTQLEGVPPNRLYDAAKSAGVQPYEMAELIADHLDLTYVPSLHESTVDLEDLSQNFCLQNGILPIRNENGERMLVMSNPYTHVCHSVFKRYFESDISGYLITEPDNIRSIFQNTTNSDTTSDQGKKTASGLFVLDSDQDPELDNEPFPDVSIDEQFDDIETEKEESEKEDVVRIVNRLLIGAIDEGVSDIHIEPRAHHLLVRYRKDGVLQKKWELPKKLSRVLITRIKIMSDMDIAERRKPQDGGFRVLYQNRRIDIRASVIPVNTGEKGVLRVLDKESIPLDLDGLGFNEESLKLLRESLSSTKGILYFTGPTGSGKTTTMYTCLQKLSNPQVNIQTVEDPIEYNISDVNQMEVNPKAGLTFASALRGILRQDPDILMLGEIRDKETLDIAAKSAMSGHLVLSTLHTNDAASSVERLQNIGLDPFTIATTTRIIVAQRLIRQLCSSCKQPVDDTDLYLDMYPELQGLEPELFEPSGCKECAHTGYQGQTGVMECLPITESVRKAIREGKGTDVIRNIMTDELGLNTLRENAFEKVARGETSTEEALRVSMV
jgi:type II secretory ATPase GspE/PulE/Tfp pilus assembly ATPase PilB-like protein